MAETPTFGRYTEIPYEQMTPEQQDAYRSLIETRGREQPVTFCFGFREFLFQCRSTVMYLRSNTAFRLRHGSIAVL